MNIVHVIDEIGIGGAEFVLLQLVQGLQSAGHQNTIISLAPPEHLVAELEATGASVRSLDFAKGRLPSIGMVRLRDAIRNAHPDLIQGWMYHGNAAASVGRLLALQRCPVVWSIHNTLEPAPDYRRITRMAMRAGALFSPTSDAIIYVSAASARQHEQRGFSAARTVLIPNGIDVSRFHPDTDAGPRLRAELGISSAVPILGCFARWDPMKGHEVLLNAVWHHLSSSGQCPHLVLAGSGMDASNNALTALIRATGLNSRVSLLGVRSDIPQLLAGLDVFVLPSIWGKHSRWRLEKQWPQACPRWRPTSETVGCCWVTVECLCHPGMTRRSLPASGIFYPFRRRNGRLSGSWAGLV